MDYKVRRSREVTKCISRPLRGSAFIVAEVTVWGIIFWGYRWMHFRSVWATPGWHGSILHASASNNSSVGWFSGAKRFLNGSFSFFQASGQGRVHMHIAAHHRRLGGNNRDRVSPFSQHVIYMAYYYYYLFYSPRARVTASTIQRSLASPRMNLVICHQRVPNGSSLPMGMGVLPYRCPLVSGTNTPLQPSAGVPVSSYAYAQQELGELMVTPIVVSPLGRY